VSRVAVIGAGVGGLAAAIRLAAAGHEVTIYEQSTVVGGKLGRYEREGFRFDTGPSLLTLPQVFAELFAATGRPLAAELDLVEVDPLVRHVFADGTALDTGGGHAALLDRLAVWSGQTAAAQWDHLWRRAERVWYASWRHVLRSPMDGPWSLARLAWRLPDLAAIAPGQSLRGLSRRYLSDPRLRMVLDRYATYTGSDPRRAPAALVAIPYAELAYGGWYPRGGLAGLADALARRAVALGVTVHTGAPVSGVLTAHGRVSSVTVAGQREPVDIVVSNVDALSLFRDLLPLPRWAARLTARSLAGFVLLLGVRGRTTGLAHHTVFFPADYDAEFDAVFGSPGRPVADPAIYVSVPDDPAVRPDGYEAWFILVNAAPQGVVDWRAPGLAARYADHVLQTLARRGLEVRDRLLFREIRTPADLETATRAPGGAIYGGPAHGLLRPPNRGPAAGLYLVGGSVHPGGGLPMVALSAQIVADLVAADRSVSAVSRPGRRR
jgi:phytoene desaturase